MAQIVRHKVLHLWLSLLVSDSSGYILNSALYGIIVDCGQDGLCFSATKENKKLVRGLYDYPKCLSSCPTHLTVTSAYSSPPVLSFSLCDNLVVSTSWPISLLLTFESPNAPEPEDKPPVADEPVEPAPLAPPS